MPPVIIDDAIRRRVRKLARKKYPGVEHLAEGDVWTRYEGPHGGKGWKNSATGEVLYQEEKPGAHRYHDEPGNESENRKDDSEGDESASNKKLTETTEDAGTVSHKDIASAASLVHPSGYDAINETDPTVVAKLADSMRKNGWVGMPLLSVGSDALTGSHRLEAANKVGLSEIPVIEIDRDEFVAAAVAAGYLSEGDGWDDLRIRSDEERLDILRKLPATPENQAAMTVMEEEVERNYYRPGSAARLQPKPLDKD